MEVKKTIVLFLSFLLCLANCGRIQVEWGGCTINNFVAKQSREVLSPPHGPGNMFRYTVEFTNTCQGGCKPMNVHVGCGDFSSYSTSEPDQDVFAKLAPGDCVLFKGLPIENTTWSFTYVNAHAYPMDIKSATFC